MLDSEEQAMSCGQCDSIFFVKHEDKQAQQHQCSKGSIVIPVQDEFQQKKQQQVEKEATVKKELLGVPWTVRRSNLSILKEINPEYSLEGLMLK